MRRHLKTILFGALCGAFFFAATAPGSAGPLSVAVPQLGAESSILRILHQYGLPPGKQCIKWTRRFSSTHGFGHRRCVHWK